MRTRREVLVWTAAMLALPARGRAQAEPAKPKQLVINASGGSQIASLRQSYFNDFEKDSGIKIVDTSPTASVRPRLCPVFWDLGGLPGSAARLFTAHGWPLPGAIS